MATKLSQLDSVWNKIVRKLEKEPKDWVLYAAKEAERIFKDRLFNVQGGRATDGTLLPQYSKGYIKYSKYGKRKRATHWDLVATGDLMGAIKPNVKSENRSVIEFINNTEVEKDADLEKRAGTTIFTFSKTEKKEVIDETVKEIIKDIKKIIKESFR